MRRKSVKIISVILMLGIMLSLIVPGTANEPYVSYGYDWWWETYPVQSGYVVDRVIASNELGLSAPLRAPKDIFIYEAPDGEAMVFIVDSDNHRIVITDENFENARELRTFTYGEDYMVENFRPRPDADGNIAPEDVEAYWEEVELIGTKTTLRNPSGIHVTTFKGETRVYIADHNNSRVIACDLDGNIWMEYRRPITETFDERSSFRPSKVLTDNAGNVYVCLTNITRGAVVYSESGEFLGYFGANRVNRTVDAMLNYVLRFFLTREQMERRTRPTPVEFSNFTIDDDQFIYTVTEARSADVDIIKKLDPAGRNVFEKEGYDGFIWGDFTNPSAYGKYYSSTMVGVSVDDKGDIYLLDRESGKVFQYDKEGHLMFIFGGKGDQKGLFTTPTAVETFNDKVYVLDSMKNSITVFKLTEFGELVLEAMALYNRGLYGESLDPWGEVLKRDANYFMAYVGMGNAKLSIGEFEESLDYFYMHSRGGFGRAFKDFRIHYIRENFDKMMAVAGITLVLLIGTVVTVKVIKKRRKSSADS